MSEHPPEFFHPPPQAMYEKPTGNDEPEPIQQGPPSHVRVQMDADAPADAPARPPCCLGSYKSRFGFWTPALWPTWPCIFYVLLCTHGCTPCKDVFLGRGCFTTRSIVSCLLYPLLLVYTLVVMM